MAKVVAKGTGLAFCEIYGHIGKGTLVFELEKDNFSSLSEDMQEEILLTFQTHVLEDREGIIYRDSKSKRLMWLAPDDYVILN